MSRRGRRGPQPPESRASRRALFRHRFRNFSDFPNSALGHYFHLFPSGVQRWLQNYDVEGGMLVHGRNNHWSSQRSFFCPSTSISGPGMTTRNLLAQDVTRLDPSLMIQRIVRKSTEVRWLAPNSPDRLPRPSIPAQRVHGTGNPQVQATTCSFWVGPDALRHRALGTCGAHLHHIARP